MTQPPPLRRAFTIVELLIVVVIIALLASIGLYVGRMVAEGGKRRATQNTLQILDQVLNEYQAAKSGKVPLALIDGIGNDYPMFDGRVAGSGFGFTEAAQANPSLSIFLAHARTEAGAVDQALSKIDPKYVERISTIVTAWGNPVLPNNVGPIPGVIIKDGWGRPIRFVHPELHGGWGPGYRKDTASTSASTFAPVSNRPFYVISRMPGVELRRSCWPFNPAARGAGEIGDADQGKCTGASPYFYSCGPDGDPGTVDDNIYSNKQPTFDSDIRQGNSAN